MFRDTASASSPGLRWTCPSTRGQELTAAVLHGATEKIMAAITAMLADLRDEAAAR